MNPLNGKPIWAQIASRRLDRGGLEECLVFATRATNQKLVWGEWVGTCPQGQALAPLTSPCPRSNHTITLKLTWGVYFGDGGVGSPHPRTGPAEPPHHEHHHAAPWHSTTVQTFHDIFRRSNLQSKQCAKNISRETETRHTLMQWGKNECYYGARPKNNNKIKLNSTKFNEYEERTMFKKETQVCRIMNLGL